MTGSSEDCWKPKSAVQSRKTADVGFQLLQLGIASCVFWNGVHTVQLEIPMSVGNWSHLQDSLLSFPVVQRIAAVKVRITNLVVRMENWGQNAQLWWLKEKSVVVIFKEFFTGPFLSYIFCCCFDLQAVWFPEQPKRWLQCWSTAHVLLRWIQTSDRMVCKLV